MTEPLPIRDGIIPEIDLEREMLDYCQTQLRNYRTENKAAPTRIAIVLAGRDEDGKFSTLANSWADDRCSRMENCSVAAALLLRRATA